MTYRYPVDDLDRRAAQIALLGSFWSDVFEQTELVADILAARAAVDKQTEQNLNEAAQCLARQTTPVWHTDRWTKFTIAEEDLNSEELLQSRYGDAGLYYGDRSHSYGQVSSVWWLTDPTATGPTAAAVYRQRSLSAFPLPENLLEVDIVTSGIVNPQVVYLRGVDFVVDAVRNAIVFQKNPFDNAALPDETRHIALWAFQTRSDKNYLQNHVAYPLGVSVPSCEAAKRFLNAVWDAIVDGTSESAIRRVLAAVLDVPLVLEEEETVEVMDSGDANKLWIITDKHAYGYSKEATSAVAVGQTVRQDDCLTDSLQLFEFNRGQIPSAADLPLLNAQPAVLQGQYRGGLTFVNQDFATTVAATDTRTTVKFYVGGWQQDVDTFWAEVHRRGCAKATLAELLDERTNKTGQPVASNLPATINPLQFLVSNLWRGVAVAKLNMQQRGTEALSLELLRVLRWLQPAYTTLFPLVEVTGTSATVTMETSGTTTEPGYFSSLPPTAPALPTLTIVIEPTSSVTLTGTTQQTDDFCLEVSLT